ncbi:MAG TPA: hypothetical protein VI934_04730, partial [Candidatus Nanoarchaeia archaeon]|nr:hypothetical protein [Candidatus Nanoarchaeia archaeon]
MAMKMFFIETKANVGIELPEKFVGKLPKRICMAASVQFSHQLPQLQQQLKGYGKETTLLKARHSKHVGQILGCGYSK